MAKENILKVKISVYRRTTITGETTVFVGMDVKMETPHCSM
jgi:hypothetical protein